MGIGQQSDCMLGVEPPLQPAPAGTFARAYAANRRAAVESLVEADPLARCVRAIDGRTEQLERERVRPAASVRRE